MVAPLSRCNRIKLAARFPTDDVLVLPASARHALKIAASDVMACIPDQFGECIGAVFVLNIADAIGDQLPTVRLSSEPYLRTF